MIKGKDGTVEEQEREYENLYGGWDGLYIYSFG